MSLVVEIPKAYRQERCYILRTLLTQFLGLEFRVAEVNREGTRITLGDMRELVIADALFGGKEDIFLEAPSLPDQPLNIWDLSRTNLDCKVLRKKVPVIYGENPDDPAFLAVDDDHIELGLDIFGSCFFMLTRYEEAIKPDRDQHGRFPAAASLAHQEGFLERPIVDEYVEILWACLERLWPQLERKPRQFQLRVTHDVDRPFRYLFASPRSLLGMMAEALAEKGDILHAIRDVLQWTKVKAGDLDADPFNTFDWIMCQSELVGVKSAFYFMGSAGNHSCEGHYNVSHPALRRLLKSIDQRGHEIGLHPNYFAYGSKKEIKRELERLQQVLEEERIGQRIKGGRQHYLRWDPVVSWQSWERVGLEYDSTVGFADHVGFRCGTCRDYTVFDILERRSLKIHERPLIIMEVTLLDDPYMNVSGAEEALKTILGYKKKCKFFGGNFTLLWHNSTLYDPIHRWIYSEALRN